ncbi:T9SS type A sorting domain-containing protein [candidate division KSB1 bacterium]|nr:T9SS type A sorting domain-containing protein [candidate division KSB1 bacterium]
MNKRLLYITFFILFLSGSAKAQWEALRSMPAARYGASAVVYDDQIYVIGGYDENDKPVNTVSIYDPWANAWFSNGKDLQIPRGNAAVVLHRDSIFVIGGENAEGEPLSSVEVYHRNMPGWKVHSQMNEARKSLSAVNYMGRIYALGGLTGDDAPTGSIEYWDDYLHKWTISYTWQLDPSRESMASVVADDAIYAFGGLYWGPLMVAERYSLDDIKMIPSMPESRYDFAAVTVDDTIYVFGGLTQGNADVNVIPTLLKYSAPTNEWIATNGELDLNVYGHCAVLYYDHIYVFGGQQFSLIDRTSTPINTVLRLKVQRNSSTTVPVQTIKPTDYHLYQNYPNPFNASTVISTQLGRPTSDVKIVIYNLRGEHIRTFELGPMDAGDFRIVWHGADELGHDVASGVYIYRLIIDGQGLETRKMMLLR